jgi:hypothetical protein
MSTAIQVPDKTLQQITHKRDELLTQAKAIEVHDEATYRQAGELALAIAELKKTITADFAAAKEAAHRAHKAICDQERKHLEALKEPDTILRGKLAKYATDQEKARQMAEEAAIQAARKKAEEEVINRAVALEQEGQHELAERVLRGPVIPEAPAPVAIAKPQAAGVAMVSRVQFTITDPNLVPRQFCVPDEKKIRAHVNAFGSESVILGVRVWVESVPRIGGRIAEAKPVESVKQSDVNPEAIFG